VGRSEVPELSALGESGEAASTVLFRESELDVEWSAVALTTIARAALGEPARPAPLDPEDARRALDRLLTPTPPRALSERFGELAAERRLGPAARFLAQALEHDVGELPATHAPDPRIVRAFLFA